MYKIMILWDSLEQKASYTRAGQLQEMGQSKEQLREGLLQLATEGRNRY